MRNIILILLVATFSIGESFARRPPATGSEKASGTSRTSRSGLKVANCLAAQASAVMEFNNVRAKIENGGSMWQERSNNTPAYEIPKGSNTHSIYSGALWMGGKEEGTNNLRLAAITFRSNGEDFFPGPLRPDSGSTEAEFCLDFDRFWVASKAEALIHQGYHAILKETEGDVSAANAVYPNWSPEGSEFIQEWGEIANNPNPVFDKELAPYNDLDGDGKYEPEEGDFPGYDILGEIACREQTRRVPLFGDTTIYWIFNDNGNRHGNSNANPIGMEIRAQAFSFADQTAINNMTFVNYVLINRGAQVLDTTYFGQWVDADLGFPQDDYVGCDVQRGLGYCYNGDNDDEVTGNSSPGYGAIPPAVGIDFFQGPFQDDDGRDNYGPFDEILAPEGDLTPTAEEAYQDSGIPYLGIGIGYGDGVVDNERYGMRKFIYYNNPGTPGVPQATTDPDNGQDYYNFLRGIWKDGSQMLYGGNGHFTGFGGTATYPEAPFSLEAVCDYMYPDETDPLNFGTGGIDYTSGGSNTWNEVTAGFEAGDRRFMQSAGPFKLKPGQINNITVGVVWARATQGNNLSSIAELKKVDDIAQSLFDNCFQIFEGPDAPDVQVTELDKEIILSLSNPATSNNFQESYSKIRPSIPGDEEDRSYEFEGYIVYQLKDETVSVSDLDNPDLAQVVSQSDIRNFKLDQNGQPDKNNPIADLINYEDDPDLGLPVPRKKVEASNSGVVKSIRITKDLFAEGANQNLVNNKPYYYLAIAYGYNEFQEYNPVTNEGQFEPFVPSRKNGRGGSIQSVSAIPHSTDNQYGGTKLNAEYGDEFQITRVEGRGNGGRYVRLTQESEDRIMDGAPWIEDSLTYEVGFGPINVSVADPLNLVPAEYTLKIVDSLNSRYEKPEWLLYVRNLENDRVDTLNSNNTLDLGGQDLVFANVGDNGSQINMGIAINISQLEYDKVRGIFPTVDWYTAPAGDRASIRFENPELSGWLSGLSDQEGENAFNWIRGGNVQTGTDFTDALVSAGAGGITGIDVTGSHENYLGGTWSPARLVANYPDQDGIKPYVSVVGTDFFVNGTVGANSKQKREVSLWLLTSADVVYTNDKSKWTRCVVLETSDEEPENKQFRLKEQPSIDKNGRQAGDPGYNAAEGDLTDPIGMGWFPGYAIDPESGERLNIAYGEDSRFVEDNGNDMMFNPTNTILREGVTEANATYEDLIVGGRHYLYIFRNGEKIISNVSANNNPRRALDKMPAYDEGVWARENVNELQGKLFTNLNWVNIPLVNEDLTLSYEDGYVPTETRIELRLEKKYEPYPRAGVVLNNEETRPLSPDGDNSWGPHYKFSTDGFQADFDQNEIVKENFESIRAVPNPYYGYSRDYETDRLDNRIRITNLPERATIKIFTVNGTLIRQLEKANRNSTTIDWDLKNTANIPIASGTYIIHINMPGLGEKVIKWFGVMRDQDLQNL